MDKPEDDIDEFFIKRKSLINALIHKGVPADRLLSFLENEYVHEKSEKKVEYCGEGRGRPAVSDETIQRLIAPYKNANIKLEWTNDKGYGFNAKKKFIKGEHIISEKPVFMININELYCDNCMAKLGSLSLHCPECNMENFCSHACYIDARSKYHSSVCGIDTNVLKENGRRGVSASAKFGLLIFRIFSYALVNKTDAFSLDWFGQLSGWKDMKISSDVVVNLVDVISEISKGRIPKEWLSIDLFTKMISVLSINCFAIHVENDPYNYCTGSGCALYGFPSFFNHSCVPNAFWSVRGNKLEIICVKKIAKGEEIFVSYIDSSLDYKARKNALFMYGFECKCSRCV